MGVLSSVRLESWIAIMITLMACFTRLSMAAGQVFYVIAILLSIFYIWNIGMIYMFRPMSKNIVKHLL